MPTYFSLPLLLCASLITGCAQDSQAAPSEALDWFRGYLEIDTTNPPGAEHRAVSWLREILHREGIATQLLVSPAGRPNLFARLEPREPTVPASPALVLTHHMDVVAPGPGWSVDPFAGLEKDGWIWGRGTVDVKSLGIAQLAAFIQLHRQGGPKRRAVIYLAVADEESGGSEGTAWVLDQHPELFTNIAAVLGEGGANRFVNGNLFWWGLEAAQKRPLWLRVTAYGRGGHGSMLNPGSAPHQLTQALTRLLERPRTYQVSPEARRYLQAVAPYQSDFFQEMVANLDEIVALDDPYERLFPGVANQLLETIQVNVVEIGERINVVPDEASAEIDVRLLPGTDEQEFLEEIQELMGSHIEIEVLLSGPRVAASPTENPVYRCLEQVLSPVAPVVPAFIPGVTDSRFYRERGIPAYGFSPFLLGAEETRGIHAANERIGRASFLKGLDVYSDVVTSCSAH